MGHNSLLHGLVGWGGGNHSPHTVPQSKNGSAVSSPGALRPSIISRSFSYQQLEPLRLSFRIESPPAIMYGPPEESTGAIISGIFDLEVLQDEPITIVKASMAVVQKITFTLPASMANKAVPKVKVEELATWDVLKHDQEFTKDTFSYPFSHLLPGLLPCSCTCKLFEVEYYLHAVAVAKDCSKPFELKYPITVGRSVLSVQDRSSVRVFPPTDLSLSMILPTVVFPNSKVAVEMRLEGLVGNADEARKITRWQVKRVSWQFDEINRVMPLRSEGSDADVEPLEDRKVLAHGVYKSGWKTDYTTQKGIVEMISADFVPNALAKVGKDLHDPVAGLFVGHLLNVEILIAEEVVHTRSQKEGTLTGSARVLRMQFRLPVVDRPGLGISWDDEVPPMYSDIPLSPPSYDMVNNLPPLEDFQNMTFDANGSPAVLPAADGHARHLFARMQQARTNVRTDPANAGANVNANCDGPAP